MNTIPWSELDFGYRKTAFNIRCTWKDGAWGELSFSDSEFLPIHIAATGLHYGQQAFEGLKAFMGQDGKIRLFRPQDNAARLQNSARGLGMPEVPTDLFLEASRQVINKNLDFIPPYGSGAALYIRPLLIGTGAQVGVKAANEYMFIIFVTPVGPYFKSGFKPSAMVIERKYDRAAPKGTGHIKVGGNYAASIIPGQNAHNKGYSTAVFLDSKEKKYIDECGPANFFGIKDNTYITPASDSILPSITNKSLMQLAKDMGMKVEQRKVPVEELATFEEAGACGTAAVISPIQRIDDLDENKSYIFTEGDAGKISTELYHRLQKIQNGDLPDPHHWVTMVD